MERKSSPAAAFLVTTLVTLAARGDPPAHLDTGGLCDLATDFRGAPDRWINGVLPAGDVDGDGKDDLLFRDIPLEPGDLPDDQVVLLYGQPFPSPVFDLYAPGIRRTVITTGEWSSGYRWDRFAALKRFVGLAAAQDVNGDARPDLLVTSGHDPRTGGPAMLLLYGNPRGGAFPESIE